MTIFDPHIRSQSQSEDSLKHLNYFGTQGVLTTAYGHRRFANADDLIAYFDDLVGVERQRLNRCGLDGWVALGVSPEAEPERAHGSVWPALQERLQRSEVVALGEVGVWRDEEAQWELFQRQVRIARQLGSMPIVVTPPAELKITMTYKMMTWLERFGYPADRVVMGFMDEALLENVVASGFKAAVPLGATTNPPRRSAAFIAKVAREQGADSILLTASMRAGAGDVLGVPKVMEALAKEEGIDAAMIDRMVRANATELFLGDAHWGR